MKLRHLDKVAEAFDLVRQTCSAAGAELVANYCIEDRNYRGAIEFLLMANKNEEAFKLAQQEGLVEAYTSVLGEHIGVEDARKVASYYEKMQDYGKAGRCVSTRTYYCFG